MGCVAYTNESWDGALIERSGDELRSSNLLFGGSCSQRRQCSVRSAQLDKGQVEWACEGVADCKDTGLWVAAPSGGFQGRSASELCGRKISFCIGPKCVEASVRDVSVYRDKWEASQEVLSALNVASGVRANSCGAYGAANAAVSLNKRTQSGSSGQCSPDESANGYYCGGNFITGDPKTLYECANGVKTVKQVCAVACERKTDVENDACSN